MQDITQIYQNRIQRLHRDLMFFMLMFLFVVIAMAVQGWMAIGRLQEIRDQREVNVLLLKTQVDLRQQLLDARTHEQQLIEQQQKDAKTIQQQRKGIAQKPKNSGGGVQIASYYDYARIAGYPGFTGHTHLTAASRDYPKGTMLRVCRADNQTKCVDVLVNDYGPQAYTGKSIDLSKLAFMQIESIRAGVVKVTITKI